MKQRLMRFGLACSIVGCAIGAAGCDDETTAPPTIPADMGASTPMSGTMTPSAGADASPAPMSSAGTAAPPMTAGMMVADPAMTPPMAAAPIAIAAPAVVPAPTLMGAGMPGSVSVAGGRFAPLTGYEMSTASGFALISRSASATTVSLQVNGLAPMTAYPAHLHALPCALSAGGHYKLDPTVEDTVQENEIWPLFETDASGSGWAEVSAEHVAREDGMSVVVHDPAADNQKMLCADLDFAPSAMDEAQGVLAAFAAAEEVDMSLMGSATLTRTSTGTTASLSVAGLSPEGEYIAHVHALPCAVNDAGGHYKLDPAVEDTVETNELWLSLTPDAMGMALGEITSDHIARPDAQSIVVHRASAEASLKVACADLVRPRTVDLKLSGAGALLPAGVTAGLTQLTGAAYLTRLTSGESWAQLVVSGASPAVAYPAHVHDRPCAIEAGGGHYKFDRGVMETVENNEVWLPLTTDAAGNGSSEVLTPSGLRADAQAVVLHSPEGDRLACFDLTTPVP